MFIISWGYYTATFMCFKFILQRLCPPPIRASSLPGLCCHGIQNATSLGNTAPHTVWSSLAYFQFGCSAHLIGSSLYKYITGGSLMFLSKDFWVCPFNYLNSYEISVGNIDSPETSSCRVFFFPTSVSERNRSQNVQ